MNRLMLGAGGMRREGWKTLDAKEADFVAKIPPLPDAVKDVKWDEIEWIHGITSLYPWEAQEVLSELRNCLCEGGRLVLEQPNADLVCASGVLPWIFGDPTAKDPLLMNHWAYNPTSLQLALHQAGFNYVLDEPAQHHFPPRDFRTVARV